MNQVLQTKFEKSRLDISLAIRQMLFIIAIKPQATFNEIILTHTTTTAEFSAPNIPTVTSAATRPQLPLTANLNRLQLNIFDSKL